MGRPDFGGTLFAALAILILAAVVVPFVLFREHAAFTGAFLFWTVFGIAATGLILLNLWRWRV